MSVVLADLARGIAVLAVHSPPASKVKPGWLAFWIVMAMLAAVVFLGFSLRKHLKRVTFIEEPPRPRAPRRPEAGASQPQDLDRPADGHPPLS